MPHGGSLGVATPRPMVERLFARTRAAVACGALLLAGSCSMDSLGDVYLAAGDKRSAFATAKQALALLEHDTVDTAQRGSDIRTSAEAELKQLSPP